MTRAVVIPNDTVMAYHATTYRVDLPDGQCIALRIGETNGALAALHAEHSVSGSVFVTARNPFGKACSETENDEAMDHLRAWLQTHGYAWLTGAGTGDDDNWPPEASVLVLGANEAVADELCVLFEQNAVVVNGKDAIPRLRPSRCHYVMPAKTRP